MESAKNRIKEIIQNKEVDIMKMSLFEFSAYLNFSQSSIVKSLKQLGYEGWKDFKLKIYMETIMVNKHDENLLVESILATKRSIDDNENFDNLVNLIIEANQICIQGIGDNNFINKYFAKQLQKVDIYPIIFEFKEQLPKTSDLLIIMSKSWKSLITNEVYDYAKNIVPKISTIVMNNPKTPLRIDNVVNGIFFQREEQLTNNSDIVFHYVINLLVEAIRKKKGV